MSNRSEQVPTLVVGLGGKGGEIVKRLLARLARREGQSERVVLHYVDTNSLDLASHPLHRQIGGTTQLGSEGYNVVGRFEKAYPDAAKWFPFGRQLNAKSTLEGAGQIRAVARLTTYDMLARPTALLGLERAVDRLQLIRDTGQVKYQPRVVVTSSLAGGTGSGSVIQLALYLRDLIAERTNEPADSITVRGFFMLPDVLVGRGVPASQWDAVRANAQAAIKEIEAIRVSINQPSNPGVELEYQRMAGTNRVQVNPFNSITLFDNQNMKGANLLYETDYLDQMSHSLHLALFSPLGKTQFSIEDNDIRALEQSNGGNRYSGAAVAEAVFPIDDVVEYLAKRWIAEELSELWLKPDEEYDRAITTYESELRSGVRRTKPQLSEVFLRFLKEQATSGTADVFFRRVYNQTQQLDEKGRETASRASTWISELSQWVTTQVKANAPTQPSLDSEALKTTNIAQSTVQRHEGRLAEYRQEAARVAQDLPASLFVQITRRDADQPRLGIEGGRHRMLAWLLEPSSEPIHPIAIRAVLYEAIDGLGTVVTSLEHAHRDRKTRIDAYEKEYDDPDTEEFETASSRIDKLSRRTFFSFIRMGKDYKDFVEDYSTRSASQATRIAEYLTNSVIVETFNKVRTDLQTFLAQWEDLFRTLRDERNHLWSDQIGLETKHERTENPTRRYVFASAKAKKALWNEYSRDLGTRQDNTALAAGFEEIYRDFAGPKKRSKAESNSIAKRYVETVLASARASVRPTNESADVGGQKARLPRDIISAIYLEAELEGRPGDQYAASLIQGLPAVAVPFVQVSRSGEDGRPFWGISSDLIGRMGADVNSAFGSVAVQYEDAFDPYELIYYRVINGFSATELVKFIPSGAGDGAYLAAYERIRSEDRVRLASLDRNGQEPAGVHLDKRWAVGLPDFWAEVVAPAIRAAMIRGLCSGQLRTVDGHWLFGGEALCESNGSGQLVRLLQQLERRSDIVRSINEGYRSAIDRDLQQYGSRLQYHQAIKSFRKVPGTDTNVLALVADMFNGSTQSLGPRIELTTTVFETACRVIRDYHHATLPTRTDAEKRAETLLSNLDETALEKARRQRGASAAEVTAMWERFKILKRASTAASS